jgi:hypothetical protein
VIDAGSAFFGLAMVGGGALLAAFDLWDAGQWLFNLIVTVTLGYIATKNREIAKLRDEVKNAAEKQIAEKFIAMTTEMGLHLKPMFDRIENVCMRLDAGDREFRGLAQAGHAMEKEFLQRIGELRDLVRKECASSADLDAVRKDVRHMLAAVATKDDQSRMREEMRRP